MKISLLDNYINEYKRNFAERFINEKYKWKAIKHFQKNWDINTTNFLNMYENSVQLTENLLNQGGIKRPIQMIKDYCNEGWEDNVKIAFQNLFDENKDINIRINEFLNKIDSINTERNIENNATWSSYHDLNTVSTYLWLKYPDKYFMYKYSVVKELTKTLFTDYQPKSGIDNNEFNFTNTQCLYKEINSKIIKDSELLKLLHANLDNTCYTDNNLYLLTQDLGYFISNQNNENKNEAKIIDRNTNMANIQTEHSLNQILYGPPGTGKTYNTVVKAMEIINPNCVKYDEKGNVLNYTDVKNEFDKAKENHQIEFVTFHQSYSYEEFVEGIKPDLNLKNEENLKYKLENGIFKEICNNAKQIKNSQTSNEIDFSTTRIFKMSLGDTTKNESEIYDYCIENGVVSLGFKNIDFSSCSTRENFEKLDNSWGAKALEIFKLWMRKGDIILISNGNKNIRAIAKITGDYEYHPNTEIEYTHFRNVKWLYKGENIPINKIYNKNLSQQSIYAFYSENRLNTDEYNGKINTNFINEIITGGINKIETQPYILIIDEINRGNISKIFGELITLIEEDKRENLTITLPYSKKPFTVPKNLYIIGTMNTSDRSIASIDIALRRRFKFKEIMPNSDLVADFNCNFKECFKIMNERISVLLDRDHQIGHSYFIEEKHENDSIDELKTIWFDSILPLLNEYFYGDWEKLQALLGKATNDKSSFIKTIDNISFASDYSCEDNEVYDFDTNCDFIQAMKIAFGDKFKGE